jgi:hypothetical protein
VIRTISWLFVVIIAGQVLGLDGKEKVEPVGGEDWLNPNVRSRFPAHTDVLETLAENVLKNPWPCLRPTLVDRTAVSAHHEDEGVNRTQGEEDVSDRGRNEKDEGALRQSALERFVDFPWLPCVTPEHPSSIGEVVLEIPCSSVVDSSRLAADGLPNFDVSIPLDITTPLISYFSAPEKDPSGATQVPCFLVRCKTKDEDEPTFRISWVWHSLFVGWFRTRLRCETNKEPFFDWEQKKEYSHEVLEISS